ncbi:uncharacterized protein G2W53_031849 [Senna tora]|uniref:Uncharacterized protein n=1 Tax=Senna tora TaxID=362788 RepID=A0A834W761_9FABA|nr:uncharacterized protein G2W53_031849 [Senna tora]
MAAIESNTKTSFFHIRCNSFPSAPHSTVSQCEEHLNRLKSSETASSSSSSSIRHNLSGLQDLHDSINEFLQLQVTQKAFASEFISNKCVVDELLDGSLRLLDICSVAKECLLQSKESILELQSAIRRKRGAENALAIEGEKYLASRKKVKKAIQKALKSLKGMRNASNDESVSMLKEAEEVTVRSLESLLLFISNPSKKSKLSVISKLMMMQPKRVACDAKESELNEFEMVDSTLKSSSIDNFQSHMENLEMCLEDLEIFNAHLQISHMPLKILNSQATFFGCINLEITENLLFFDCPFGSEMKYIKHSNVLTVTASASFNIPSMSEETMTSFFIPFKLPKAFRIAFFVFFLEANRQSLATLHKSKSLKDPSSSSSTDSLPKACLVADN